MAIDSLPKTKTDLAGLLIRITIYFDLVLHFAIFNYTNRLYHAE